MSVPVGTAYDATSLATNRAGQLTPDQRTAAGRAQKSGFQNEFLFAGIAVVIGVLVATSSGGNYPEIARLGVGAVAFVIAAVLVVRALSGQDPLTRDLRAGRVESVEGAFGKHQQQGQRLTWFYFDLGNRRFEVSRTMFDAAPDAGVMRLYLLPHSGRVVNFERLPDRAVPAGAMDSPGAALASVVAGLRSNHSQASRLEAMASMEALKDAMFVSPTPPPAGEQDPRPLAEAVVGSWQWAGLHVTFGPDGRASTVLPNGQAASGHWSVSGDGKLHVSGMGEDMAGEAWVAGDTLTVKDEGRAIAFRRTA